MDSQVSPGTSRKTPIFKTETNVNVLKEAEIRNNARNLPAYTHVLNADVPSPQEEVPRPPRNNHNKVSIISKQGERIAMM